MDLNLRGEIPSHLEDEEEDFRGKQQKYHYPFASSSSTPSSPLGDGSMKSLEFTDLSMNRENHDNDDKDEEDERVDNNEINRQEEVGLVEKEHMFDKVVTPSDVGKLNRLVIPKQYAERFFPLDPSTSDYKTGLLLSFEDRNGKPWRFRYSYWNSSQSYVMTKGWSRFVKEKKLDAGDIVSFQRGVHDKHRLFIDWRHKPMAARLQMPMSITYPGTTSFPHSFSFHRPNPNATLGTWSVNFPSNFSRDHHQQFMGFSGISSEFGVNQPRREVYGNMMNSRFGEGSVFYVRSSEASRISRIGVEGQPVVFDSVPVAQGTQVHEMVPTNNKRQQLRLFGVNMDCPMSESDEVEDSYHVSSSKSGQSNVYNGMPVHRGWLDKGKGPTSSSDFGT